MARGHSLTDVLQVYTVEQVQSFVEGARVNRTSEILDMAYAFRAAQADDKNWKRYVGSMSAPDTRERSQKVVEPTQVEHLMRLNKKRAG